MFSVETLRETVKYKGRKQKVTYDSQSRDNQSKHMNTIYSTLNNVLRQQLRSVWKTYMHTEDYGVRGVLYHSLMYMWKSPWGNKMNTMKN